AAPPREPAEDREAGGRQGREERHHAAARGERDRRAAAAAEADRARLEGRLPARAGAQLPQGRAGREDAAAPGRREQAGVHHQLETGELNDEQLLRYSRHILLPEIGVEGQEKLRAAHALVVGAGGLGCPAALYLAASRFGRLT